MKCFLLYLKPLSLYDFLSFIPPSQTVPSSKDNQNHTDFSCFGHCDRCKTDHFLPFDKALHYCLELMQVLEEKKRIDLLVSDDQTDSRFSTDYLFSEARGKMFGVLVCRDKKGCSTVLRSFSGQYNGIWEVDGWVPPLFSAQELHSISHNIEKKIKEMGREIENHNHQPDKQRQLIRARKSLSRNLMKQIHGLYSLSNFDGETRSIEEVYIGAGIPTGTGDCCAPKLLNYAAQNNLFPLSLAEFYWGKENLSGTRKHGEFYSSCPDKCQPILGYMLCGL